MNIAGPSQLRSSQHGANERLRNGASEYEEGLRRLIHDLGPEGAQHLREFYESRALTGQTMTDHDMAMSLFLQNAADIAAEDEGQELTHLLADDLNIWEDDITAVVEDRELARLLAYGLNIWEDDTHTPGDIDLSNVLQ